jgi:hypothetical protein
VYWYRAIALCSHVAEEQARAVVIAEHGAQFTAAQAIFGFAVTAQQIQRHASNQGKVLSGMVPARPVGILVPCRNSLGCDRIDRVGPLAASSRCNIKATS